MYYFNKHANDLTLGEATILAGIPKSPSYYSPISNEENAKKRQLSILNSMVENGYITQNERDNAYNEELVFTNNFDNDEITSLMYYQDAVINELKSILNTNASIKSQISSIYHEPKDIENEKVPEGEIFSYMDNNDINVKKKKHKKKSLSLLERKLSSLSSINNRRNILRVNNINRSHNSKNNSKRVNINKINKIEIQNYINNPKNERTRAFLSKMMD